MTTKVRVAMLSVVVLAWATIAHAQTDTVTYMHTDGIGSVRMLTNESAQVIARYDYAPFGEPCTTPCGTSPSTATTRQFAGQERDTETGLDYFGARYYRNIGGRFITVDPAHVGGDLFDPQSWNAYAYARNNPLSFIDPTGTDYFVNIDGGGTFSFEGSFNQFSAFASGFSLGGPLFGTIYNAAGKPVGTYRYYDANGFDAMVYRAGRTAEAAVAASAKQIVINAAVTTLFAPIAFAEWTAPVVTDAKLARIVGRVYKGLKGRSVPVGNGSTADAIRNEMLTGQPTFGSFHTQAGKELAKALGNWIAENPNAARGEMAIAKALLRELRNALAGR
jgi:RHS repeat-associated protein